MSLFPYIFGCFDLCCSLYIVVGMGCVLLENFFELCFLHIGFDWSLMYFSLMFVTWMMSTNCYKKFDDVVVTSFVVEVVLTS